MDIMVQGEGKKFYKPNEVVFDIKFFANDSTYDKVLEKGMKEVEEFIKGILNVFNINKEDLKTRSFRISQNMQYDYKEKKQIDCGFDYNQSATLKMEYNIDTISEFIDKVAQLKNPPKYSMFFDIKEKENAKKEVIGEAYNKAKEKAEIIALSSGKRLKDCVKIDFRSFEEKVYSKSRIASADFFEEGEAFYAKDAIKNQYVKDIIQNTFTPEDVEIRETLYCLWIAE